MLMALSLTVNIVCPRAFTFTYVDGFGRITLFVFVFFPIRVIRALSAELLQCRNPLYLLT